MQIPVLIEPVAGNGYRARGVEPFGLAAEGTTPGEALANLNSLLQHRLAQGAQLVLLEISGGEHPLARSAGVFQAEDPLVQDWLQIMDENRRKADQDPDYL